MSYTMMMRKASSPSHDHMLDTAPVHSEGVVHHDGHHNHHAKDNSEPDSASQTSQTDSHHSSLVVHAHDSVADMSDDHRSLLGHPPSHEEGYGSANERGGVHHHHPMQDMMSDGRSHSTAEGYQSAGALSDGEGRLDAPSGSNVAHHYPFHHPHKYAAFSSTRSVGSTGGEGGGGFGGGPPGKVMIAHGRLTPSHNNLSLHPMINSETRFPTYAASEAAKSDIATVW